MGQTPNFRRGVRMYIKKYIYRLFVKGKYAFLIALSPKERYLHSNSKANMRDPHPQLKERWFSLLWKHCIQNEKCLPETLGRDGERGNRNRLIPKISIQYFFQRLPHPLFPPKFFLRWDPAFALNVRRRHLGVTVERGKGKHRLKCPPEKKCNFHITNGK